MNERHLLDEHLLDRVGRNAGVVQEPGQVRLEVGRRERFTADGRGQVGGHEPIADQLPSGRRLLGLGMLLGV
jgi:hypothetical protein